MIMSAVRIVYLGGLNSLRNGNPAELHPTYVPLAVR
jgi:hypothetical protein